MVDELASATTNTRAFESSDDTFLLERIRAGEETAFDTLVRRYHTTLIRLARARGCESIADEVVQETWLEMLRGLDRFEGRSSFKTWLCGIVINVARARTRKEKRTVPLSAFESKEEASVDPDRFLSADHHWAGHWSRPPAAWSHPEQSTLTSELRKFLNSAVADLPSPQREVLVLRDIEGMSGEEVCNILDLNDTHQRVLLHRARSKVRAALEVHYAEGSL